MKNKVMFIAIVITVTATVTANAGVILSEYFSGNGDPLNGKTADMFSPEIVNAGGSASWVAYSSFSDDGTVIADGVGPDGRTRAYLNLGSYIDDAKGSVAGKFDLTMTMSLNSGNWLSLGFAQSNTPGGSDFTGVKGIGTIIYRDSVELDMFAGLGTAGGVDGPDNNSGARTLTVSIDVTSATGPGTVTWFDSELGHLGTAALPDSSIGSILITTPTDGCISTISDLTLTGGKIVSSAVDTPLTWTNRDPNTGEDVYVEVYCDQTNPLTTLVAEGLGISSATVDTTVLGTYYWRVDTYRDYVDESNKGPVTTGPVCYFVSVSDAPVSSVDAGADMISWSGQPIVLSATVVDDGKSGLTYAWSADPNSGVALTEVPDDGDALASNSENPTVTITKATNNPSTVTLTVAVNDAGNPDVILEDSMKIDVYDDACKAASATGGLSAGDLNGDCLTNLADLAVMADSWLIDTKISGPVVK